MSADPRRPTGEEQALLDAFLAGDFPGVDELRLQAREVRVAPRCECGCGSLDLAPQGVDVPRSLAASPVPWEGVVVAGSGEPVGCLLLFVEDGLLSFLEIYSLAGESLPLPVAADVVWCASWSGDGPYRFDGAGYVASGSSVGG